MSSTVATVWNDNRKCYYGEASSAFGVIAQPWVLSLRNSFLWEIQIENSMAATFALWLMLSSLIRIHLLKAEKWHQKTQGQSIGGQSAERRRESLFPQRRSWIALSSQSDCSVFLPAVTLLLPRSQMLGSVFKVFLLFYLFVCFLKKSSGKHWFEVFPPSGCECSAPGETGWMVMWVKDVWRLPQTPRAVCEHMCISATHPQFQRLCVTRSSSMGAREDLWVLSDPSFIRDGRYPFIWWLP